LDTRPTSSLSSPFEDWVLSQEVYLTLGGTMHIPLKQRVLLLCSLLVLLSGCGSALVAASSAGDEPTSLQVYRVNLIPENAYPPFPPHTITAQQTVQRLYNMVQALPRWNSASGQMSCPVWSGLEYQLDFFQGQTLMQKVIYRPGGCSSILIGKNDVRVPSKLFAQSFVQAMGTPEKELFPTPMFSCNPKSPCSSPTP